MSPIVKIFPEEIQQQQQIQKYYRFQSHFYDLTRWAFLFGRKEILNHIPFTKNDSFHVAEIGCGTGFNLKILAKEYKNIQLTGVDVSSEMITIAKEKLFLFNVDKTFVNLPYNNNSNFLESSPDVILFSYFLTMVNPHWKDMIDKAFQDLKPGGKILVTDFYDSRFSSFKNHMSNHHVRMDSHLLPELSRRFDTKYEIIKSAYGGVWQYFLFVGQKNKY